MVAVSAFLPPFFISLLQPFDKLIKFVKICIGEDRAGDSALGNSGKAILSCFSHIHVSCVEKFPDEVKKPLTTDLLLQDCHECAVMHLIKADSYVSLYVPISARPLFSNDSECCMATSIWPKTMACIFKERRVGTVVDGFENQANDLLHDFIRDTWHTQSTLPHIPAREEPVSVAEAGERQR